jgi:pimeloyl-ACP methyl ester carboxylesterase
MPLRHAAGPAGELAIDDAGRGELPVVFLHSLAGNIEHWRAQLDHLRPNHRAVAIDLRGHGRSEPALDGDYSTAAMAADVAAAVDALEIPRFVLVGHSMGGTTALAYAGTHPERVAALVLVDANVDARRLPPEMTEQIAELTQTLESAAYEEAMERYWEQIAGPSDAVRERLIRDLRATPREVVVPAFKGVLDYDPAQALDRYHGPKLAIVTPFNDQPASLHRIGAGFPHHVVSGTGHWIHLDRPDEVNALLDAFLAHTPGAT